MICVVLTILARSNAMIHTRHNMHVQIPKRELTASGRAIRNYFLPSPRFLHFAIDDMTTKKEENDRSSTKLHDILMSRNVVDIRSWKE